MDNRLILFAGAGLSAESGLATFREKGGIWDLYDVNEVCNLITFRAAKNDPVQRDKIFNFYNLLKDQVNKVKPNLAHEQIARWQEEFGTERVKIITTNIDDLLEKAGAKEVLHVHGNMEHMQCVACDHHWAIGTSEFVSDERCPKCDSRLTKPAIIFFNEKAPLYLNMHQILNHKHKKQNDVIMVIGCSLQVIDANTILQPQRKSIGYSVLINKEQTYQDHMFDYVIHGLATDLVPGLDPLINKKMGNVI